MAGFRAAGWTCCGTVIIALITAIVGMRGVGLVGQQEHPSDRKNKEGGDVEMGVMSANPAPAVVDAPSHNGSVATLTEAIDLDNKAGSKGAQD